MAAPDDLDDYLRGDSALSRQYKKESAPMPPHALDRRVLASARGSAGREFLARECPAGESLVREPCVGESAGAVRRLTPCLAPLALAASVLLSVALVLAIVFGPQTAKRIDDAPRVVRVAVHADAVPNTPPHRHLQLYGSDLPGARAPSVWLADIAALRRAGRYREADVEYRRFRSAYPAYSTGGLAIGP
jgi:hypothetical protein